MADFTAHGSNCGMKDMTIGWTTRGSAEIIEQVCRKCLTKQYGSGSKLVEVFKIFASHVVFSQAISGREKAYGKALAAYIKAHKLGHVAESEPQLNPVHGPSIITAYVWTLDEKGLKKWWDNRKETK